MGQIGRIKFKDGTIATLYNGDTWECEKKVRQFWLNVRFGRWKSISGYLPAAHIRLQAVAYAFDAEIIEFPDKPKYPPHSVVY